MAYHVVIKHGLNHGQMSLAVNVTAKDLRERFVEPWFRGEPIVSRGRQFNAGDYSLALLEGGEVEEPTGRAEEAQLAVQLIYSLSDVTDKFITGPSGSKAPPATRMSGEAQYASDRRKVMVVHGRNGAARDAMFAFLRSLDLRPLEWSELVAGAASGAPYIGTVLDDAFSQAQAAVVLMTPDDLAYLHPDFVKSPDYENEAQPRGQARPNVFFEAGMAFGRFPDRTILAELGHLRPASDLAGRHAVRLDQSAECRKDLAERLAAAGCLTNTDGVDWLSAGDFHGALVDAPSQEPPTDDGRDPSQVALIRRIDQLRSDLESQPGFLTAGLGEVYNGLLDEAGDSALPRADTRSGTGKLVMRGRDMRAYLGQLRATLE